VDAFWLERSFEKTEILTCAVGQIGCLWEAGSSKETSMSEQEPRSSDLVEISKLNGQFSRNYGAALGAYLYLRTVDAARQRSFSWVRLGSLLCSGIWALFSRYTCSWS
jgi:hypothetical protein